MADTNIQLGFLSAAFSDDPTGIELVGVRGHEALSELFGYELLLSRPAGLLSDKQLADIVRSPCAIALGPSAGDVVHGILVEIEHLDATRHIVPRYVARMVPQVYLLTMGRRSAIYQNMTVPKMVEQILTAHGLSSGKQFEIHVNNPGRSPEREYIVQYQESDWAFISRWLEREGYFYWFRHGKQGAALVIADANDNATPIAKPVEISYREKNNLATGGAATIFDFRVHQRRVPAKVTVVDYNYRTNPEKLVIAVKEVDKAGGFGNVFSYDNHVKDAGQAKIAAETRAERWLATQRTIGGWTDCSRFRVGHTFKLENHFHADYDGEYLITALDVRAGHDVDNAKVPSTQPIEDSLGLFGCRFEALPAKVPFRPERRTPWPKVASFITGHIDADGAGEYATIDDQGRYKVRLAFDAGTAHGLHASRWIRMAQGYAGAGYGTHFPLHKGAEVLMGHADGDPDRPLILAAVPNPHTRTTVTAANATQSVIQTASGMRVELEDRQS